METLWLQPLEVVLQGGEQGEGGCSMDVTLEGKTKYLAPIYQGYAKFCTFQALQPLRKALYILCFSLPTLSILYCVSSIMLNFFFAQWNLDYYNGEQSSIM